MRGRPPKHFHPLLQKEKELHETLDRILPEEIANSLSPNSSRLTHLYGLPKAYDTPSHFIRPSRRSAYKIVDIWHVRYQRSGSLAFAKSARCRNFLPFPLRVASKTNQPSWAILLHDFQSGGRHRKLFLSRRKGIILITLWSEKLCLFDVTSSDYSNRLKKDFVLINPCLPP